MSVWNSVWNSILSSKLWLNIISEHFNNKIAVWSLIFTMWQTEMLVGSLFDLPPQAAILETFTVTLYNSQNVFFKIKKKIISKQV